MAIRTKSKEQVSSSSNILSHVCKKQLYRVHCIQVLISFHIDFGGSSVYYHLLSGEKWFFFIEPTQTNIKLYEKWSSSRDQAITFFGDLVKECYKVHLLPGTTYFEF